MTVFRSYRLSESTLPAGLALWALLAIAWLVYAPGLKGSFLFDDWANLPPLGAQGPIDNWHTFVTYMLSGIASATGRPVAMLSFLLDANNWPAAAEPFKYTNILIHLLNGALLAWLTLGLARLLGAGKRRAAWVAVLSTGLWLLHPFMVSTTLFVVQRMAMLAATFVLAGLLCYLHGRQRLVQGRAVAAYLWMSAGVGLCGLLAALSKENGALLPLFVLVIEHFVLQRPASPLRITRPSRGWRIWKGVLLYAPLALLATYLLAHLPGMLSNYADVRDFTLGERLLTEARILVQYLYLLLIPHIYTAGLFNDNVTLSTSLFHPWTTLPAIVLIAALLILGWRTRGRYPALGLAIFFYFGGQLLESTVIPLELYYEHRNYLPAMLLFFPLALWLVTAPKLPGRARIMIGVGLLTLFAGFTGTRATLWGNPFEQAAVWARENPGSPRAQTTLALHWMQRGNYGAAAQLLQRTAHSHPDNIMLELNLLNARCALGGVTPAQLDTARRALARAKIGSRVAYNAIGKFIRHYQTTPCAGLGPAQLDGLIQHALDNPHVKNSPGWLQNVLALRGELRIVQGRPRQALALFKESLAAQPRPGAALYQAALLGTANHPREGVALLDYFATLPKRPLHGFNVGHLRALWLGHEGYYPSEIARVRKLLLQDITDQAGKRDHAE